MSSFVSTQTSKGGDLASLGSNVAALSPEDLLLDSLASFYSDPLSYVMFSFPWGDENGDGGNPAIKMIELDNQYREQYRSKYGPDTWACEFLTELGKEIEERNFDGRTAVNPIKFSTASGHGIGKSTLVSWLIKFILDTRPFSKGVVTANTAEQLRTKTWAEVSKWHAMSLTSHLFHYTLGRGSMSLYRIGDKHVMQTWRCDAQTARAENAEAFQGLHADNSTPFFVFDEASGIADEIWEARMGASTGGEHMTFDFGNPTRKSGYFYENTVGKFKHRHIVRSIDSRDVKITNKEIFRQWEKDWGEDSDFFKVRVRGVFPSAGTVQFIADDVVDEAMLREAHHDKDDEVVIGVDVARFGDNETIIYPRVANDARSFGFKRYKGLDTTQVVEKVINEVDRFKMLGKKISSLVIDGGGLGGGVVDMLRRLGYDPFDLNFGRPAADGRYRFRSDEMWGRMKEGLETHLAIPKDGDMKQQLTQREYGFTLSGNKIHLESKEDMRKRGVVSPDIVDALAMTYSIVPNKDMGMFQSMFPQFAKHEYDPCADIV